MSNTRPTTYSEYKRNKAEDFRDEFIQYLNVNYDPQLSELFAIAATDFVNTKDLEYLLSEPEIIELSVGLISDISVS